MLIDINALGHKEHTEGAETPSSGGSSSDNVYELLLENTCRTCLTLESYKEAESLLMEVLMMAVNAGKATKKMSKMIEKVKEAFVERKKPKPTKVYKGLYYYDGADRSADQSC